MIARSFWRILHDNLGQQIAPLAAIATLVHTALLWGMTWITYKHRAHIRP